MTPRLVLRRLSAAAIVACAPLLLCGCLRTKIVVTSDPPGAVAAMNGRVIGTTPVEKPFAWFWYYDIEAKKPGYESSRQRIRTHTPFWLLPPIDMFFEALPFNVHHTKRVHLDLTPVGARPRPLFADVTGEAIPEPAPAPEEVTAP